MSKLISILITRGFKMHPILSQDVYFYLLSFCPFGTYSKLLRINRATYNHFCREDHIQRVSRERQLLASLSLFIYNNLIPVGTKLGDRGYPMRRRDYTLPGGNKCIFETPLNKLPHVELPSAVMLATEERPLVGCQFLTTTNSSKREFTVRIILNLIGHNGRLIIHFIRCFNTFNKLAFEDLRFRLECLKSKVHLTHTVAEYYPELLKLLSMTYFNCEEVD